MGGASEPMRKRPKSLRKKHGNGPSYKAELLNQSVLAYKCPVADCVQSAASGI
jgi:hypothetical protein